MNLKKKKNISQSLEIPISTLHRHKVRLLNAGRLPGHIQDKKRDSKESLKLRIAKAIEACRRGMSQNHASTVYAVPKSTLWRHLQKYSQAQLTDTNGESFVVSDPKEEPYSNKN